MTLISKEPSYNLMGLRTKQAAERDGFRDFGRPCLLEHAIRSLMVAALSLKSDLRF